MRNGFTLIEILTVLAVTIILLSLSIVSLNTIQQNTYQNTTEDVLITDIKLQQLKSMTGDSGSSSTFEPYGVYFGADSYTLFRGDSYLAGNAFNFTVELNPNLSFTSVLFSDSQIVFAKNSGEIIGFIPGSNTVTLNNSITGKNTVITINKYGVITNIQ